MLHPWACEVWLLSAIKQALKQIFAAWRAHLDALVTYKIMILPIFTASTDAHSDSIQVWAGDTSYKDRNNHSAMLRAAAQHFESR